MVLEIYDPFLIFIENNFIIMKALFFKLVFLRFPPEKGHMLII